MSAMNSPRLGTSREYLLEHDGVDWLWVEDDSLFLCGEGMMQYFDLHGGEDDYAEASVVLSPSEPSGIIDSYFLEALGIETGIGQKAIRVTDGLIVEVVDAYESLHDAVSKFPNGCWITAHGVN